MRRRTAVGISSQCGGLPAGLVICLLVGWCRKAHSAQPALPGPDHWDELPDATYKVIYDREVVTTVPKDVEPKGVVFSLHGCLQMATEWGFQSPTCPGCHGMPEEMVSVYRAVRRGYALVALGPHLLEAAANFQCFNTTWPPEQHRELPELLRTLRHVLTAHGWWHLPRFAYGSSRGGAMTLILALRFPLQAVASMVMGLRPAEVMDSDFAPTNPASGASWRYPPTLLMAAANDQEEIIELVNRTASFLEGQGVVVEKQMLDPQPLTPQTFAQRMREVDMPTSEAIFFELKGVGIIQADNCSRFLEYETWKKAEAQLKKILLKHFPANLYAVNGSRGHERAFREMLWASEAIHELTAEPMDMILDFFEEHAVMDETPLHERHPYVQQQLPAAGEERTSSLHGLKNKDHGHSHALREVHANG